MMSPCKKCSANNWDYKKLDNDPHIYCRCKACGYEFSFLIPKKSCMFCLKPTDFERVDIDAKTRGKKCLLCGKVKEMEIAQCKFRTFEGKSQRLEEDGEWHTVEVMDVGKGAIQLLAID